MDEYNEECISEEEFVENEIFENEESLFETIEVDKEKAMKELIENHEKHKKIDEEKVIEEFKQMLGCNRIVTHKNKQQIFETAMKEAEDTLYSCTIISPEKLSEIFNVELQPGELFPEYDKFYWFNNFPYRKNKIPLPQEIEKPMRFNKKTKKMEEYNFTITRFYNNEAFINRCNEYFKQFNLSISFEQIFTNPRYKNNWKIQLNIISENNSIVLIP